MIVCHPLRIVFQDVPKAGSTSLLTWLYELAFGRPFEPVMNEVIGRIMWIHEWFTTQKNDVIDNQPLNEFVRPEGYFVFGLTRDPIIRFLSAYRNRIMHFRELSPVHPDGRAAIQAGLVADPTLDFFVENLKSYQKLSRNIFHHTRPMVDFLGYELSRFDKIYDLGELELLRKSLIEHWKMNDLPVFHREIPLIPKVQVGGPKLGLDVLSPESFERLLNYYKNDYELIPTCSLENIKDEKYRRAKIANKMNYQSLLIVTYGRTGSTLLQGLLNSIHGVVIRGENFNFCIGLYRSYLSLKKVIEEQGRAGKEPAQPFFGSHLFDEGRFFIDSRTLLQNQLFPYMEETVQCWGFKEIRYTPNALMSEGNINFHDYMSFLSRLMPNPAFVFLTRNHHDVVNSAFWTKVETGKAVAQIEMFEKGAKDWATDRDDCYWIDYDDIVNQSNKLHELYRFLGGVYDEATVQRILGIEHSVECKPENLARHKNWSLEIYYPDQVLSCMIEPNLALKVADGSPLSVGGVVILKPEINTELRLFAVDCVGEHPVQWGIPSPRFASKFEGNPHAVNARFKIDGLSIVKGQPVEIFLDNLLGQRELITRIKFKEET